MKAHGGGFPTSGSTRTSGPSVAARNQSGVSAPGMISGFGNFLGTSGGVARFKIEGTAPRENVARLRELMKRLSRRMSAGVAGVAPGDNLAIPSGYTYLLQFIAHDLVATSIPFWALDDASLGVRNERTSRLRLDTLYDGGPAFNPSVYAPDDKADTSRTTLRLGCIEKNSSNLAACPFRDIARTTAAGASGEQRKGLTEALIADPRNDDHVIISQFTVLFHALHNAIVEMLPTDRTLLSAHKRFVCARDATTLIYRNILRKDLLPRILHPAVSQHYDVALPQFVDSAFAADPSGPLPLEFSHGAFRFGHAMVRDEYQINNLSFSVPQLMKQTSSRNPDRMPLDASWIVNWSRFFSVGGNVPGNLSRRLSPTMSPLLMDSELFGPIDQSNWHGLPYRDLMSAALADLWSVAPLIEEIRKKNKALVAKATALKDSAWKPLLEQWLKEGTTASGLDPDDIAALAADPPLPLFVLFEAEMETEGKSLGVLGSIIVADVLYALLEQQPLAVKAGFDLKNGLANLSTALYGENKLIAIPDISSMADLIEFVAQQKGWQATQPPFI
jgi:hypothetical protein